jgi:hypothetical protein
MLIIMNLFNVRQLPKLIGKNSRKYKLFVVIGAAALFLYSIPHVYHIFEVTRERALEYNDFVNIIGIIISGMVMIGWAFWEIDEHYKSFRSRMTSFSKTQNSQVHLRKRPRVLAIAIIMMILLTVDVFYSLIQLLLVSLAMRISFSGLLMRLLLELLTVYLSTDYLRELNQYSKLQEYSFLFCLDGI